MERSWWWKALGVLLLTVLAVVYLLPSVTPEGKLPKWFGKYVKAKLNLGLDLQGGIHLVYEVQVDKAVQDKADRLAADIEERLTGKKHKLKVQVRRQGRDEVVLTFKRPPDVKKLNKKFMDDFSSTLDEIARDEAAGTVRLKMDEEYIQSIEEGTVNQAEKTIRRRVDEFGVAEPTILRKGRDIVIELPGLKKEDFERVKKQIGRTAQLEFKIVDDESHFLETVGDKVPKDGSIEVKTDSYSRENKAPGTYTFLQAKDRRKLEAFISSLKVPETHEILVGEEKAKDKKGRPLPGTVWITYLVKKRTALTGEYITDAETVFDPQTGKPEVSLTFDSTGADYFAELSGKNVGARMAIILDKQINSAPVLKERIGGGRARITLGGFKPRQELYKEAEDLSAVLRAGALPAPLQRTFERQVGPTLGEDAIRKGRLAFLIGGALVILFILYYYRGAGLICDLALIINFVYILAIMAGFQATLTLPGIAGLVLTVGMAVDANVIIYERIREEEDLGKTPRAAVDAGYSRAFWTIFDAQLTTAIAAIVLWQYGSGPIRGFAVTLLVGIVCSIFTGIVVTRLMFDFIIGKFKPKKLSI